MTMFCYTVLQLIPSVFTVGSTPYIYIYLVGVFTNEIRVFTLFQFICRHIAQILTAILVCHHGVMILLVVYESLE